jgi:DNA-binding NarL/FixJ family response regulator
MSTHTVLLVEDDPICRERLAESVGQQPELVLVGTPSTCREARQLLVQHVPEVLLVDLGLPDGDGISLIREARALSGDTLSMVVTVFGDETTVIRAIEAGARGYLLKDSHPTEVGSSILQLLQGGAPISPAIANHLLRRFQEPPRTSGQPTPILSDRETEVLRLVAKGFTFGEIAKLLSISPHTVTTHVRRMYGKLEVRSRSEAVYEAVHLGLIRIDE